MYLYLELKELYPTEPQNDVEGAKKELEKITNEAVEILEYYGDKAEFLKKLAIYIKDRNK